MLEISKLVPFIFLGGLIEGILLIGNCNVGRWGRSAWDLLRLDPHKVKAKLQTSAIIESRKKEKMEKEIYEGIAYLRNLTVMDRGKKVGSDFIISRLSEQGGLLQPLYLKMLSLLRINKKETARELFANGVGTIMGRNFGNLLLQWDEINPEELTETLLSYQKTIKEIRITNQRKKDELISDLVYLPVVVNIVFILINFVYVGYFLEQKDMLELFF